MSTQREKYLKKLSTSERKKLTDAIINIHAHNREGLDIKKIRGTDTVRRCRIGALRILFQQNSNSYTIIKILPRGDLYK